MKRFIKGECRTQTTLLPDSIDDYIANTNPVRIVDVFVDELDLGKLGLKAGNFYPDFIFYICLIIKNFMSTESDSVVLDILIAYFNDNEWPVDVNLKKLQSRSSVHSQDPDPNIKIVKIERHRAILGDQYINGLPMSAYQTYWMVYSIDLSMDDVEYLGEQQGKYEIDIRGLIGKELDYENLNPEIELLNNNQYRAYENVFGEEKDVKSSDDIYEFLLDITSGYVDNFRMRVDMDNAISKIEKDKFISEYQSELQRQLILKAKDLWDDRELS